MKKRKAAKTAAKSAVLIPQPHGGALLPGGQPGNRGGGRPRDEFKAEMRKIASSPQALTRLRDLAGAGKDVPDDVFLRAFKEAGDRGYGKAVQPLEHAGPDGGPIPIDDGAALRERIARQLAGIAARGGAAEGAPGAE